MIISWDGPNSLGYTPKFDRYFPEIKGFQGSSVFQTEPSTTEVNGINYVGPRAAYKASNAAGLLTISNYVAGLSNFGVTCRVLLRRGCRQGAVGCSIRDKPVQSPSIADLGFGERFGDPAVLPRDLGHLVAGKLATLRRRATRFRGSRGFQKPKPEHEVLQGSSERASISPISLLRHHPSGSVVFYFSSIFWVNFLEFVISEFYGKEYLYNVDFLYILVYKVSGDLASFERTQNGSNRACLGWIGSMRASKTATVTTARQVL